MKIGFELKLGIGIVVIFGLLLTGFALWTPLKMGYYVWQLHSNDYSIRAEAVEKLIGMGEEGREALVKGFPEGKDAAQILIVSWNGINTITFDEREKGGILGSPLRLAVSRNYIQLAKLFIAKGAVLHEEKERSDGSSLLHVAAYDGHVSVIKWLVSEGLLVNYRNIFGETPLHFAVEQAQVGVIRHLLSEGADVNARDMHGQTPIDRALNYKHEGVANILRAYGAETGEELELSGIKK